MLQIQFFEFLKNTICIKQPTQIEINNVLSCCYISKTNMLSHIDCNTMILCSHKKYVDKYNDLLIHKFFSFMKFSL
jgi:hypothetical protein